MPDLTKYCITKFIGTVALIFFGCCSVSVHQDNMSGSLTTVAASNGFILTALVIGKLVLPQTALSFSPNSQTAEY